MSLLVALIARGILLSRVINTPFANAYRSSSVVCLTLRSILFFTYFIYDFLQKLLLICYTQSLTGDQVRF